MVIKTFLLSIFTHILNTVHVTPNQISVIQDILNDFLWKGRSKVKHSVAYASVQDKGLTMIHVKNFVHSLRIKWMARLSKDAGSSWSQFAWSNISPVILVELWAGICLISEKTLQELSPFYASIFQSFAYINNLFYEQVDTSQFQHNLWFGCVYNYIDWDWCKSGYFMIRQLPNVDRKIDLSELTSQLKKVNYTGSPYLKVCAFQQTLGHFLVYGIPGFFVFNDQLLLCCKHLLQQATTALLSLDNWCTRLNILPLEVPEAEKVFWEMLFFCKIIKFREINFKILSQIFVMPKVISKVK